MNRSVSFEYMNRQLVWNEFSVNHLMILIISCKYSFGNIFVKMLYALPLHPARLPLPSGTLLTSIRILCTPFPFKVRLS